MSLKDKVALVTGSTSGIGLAVAKTLAQNGCNIVLNGFGEAQEIENLRNNLAKDNNIKVVYAEHDLSKAAQIDQMFKMIGSELGDVDILINNAGIQYVAPIERFPSNKWDAIIAVNLSAAFHTIRNVVPAMKKKNWGRIINIASAHGLVASKHKTAYVAAKHGIVGLTKSVALEVAEQMITCNAICPGWVLTPLVQKQIDDRAKANNWNNDKASKDLLAEKQPSLRFVQDEHIGEMVIFLCSDAGSSITGSALPMDGGWTAQ